MARYRVETALARGALFAAMALLAACATPRVATGPGDGGKPHFKIGEPYQVAGKWYRPADDPGYEATGVASWYGDAFDGRRTANGEIFDKRRLSAAHPTLPMPSLVEVQNLENGRTVVVRINDRGPFVSDRVIDVSHAAAEALGFAGQGLARVHLRYVGRADLVALAERGGGRTRETHRPVAPAPAGPAGPASAAETGVAVGDDEMARLIENALAAPSGPEIWPEIWIAVADYGDLNELEAARIALADGEASRIVSTPDAPGRFQLQVGPHDDQLAAEARLAALREAGYSAAHLVVGAF